MSEPPSKKQKCDKYAVSLDEHIPAPTIDEQVNTSTHLAKLPKGTQCIIWIKVYYPSNGHFPCFTALS